MNVDMFVVLGTEVEEKSGFCHDPCMPSHRAHAKQQHPSSQLHDVWCVRHTNKACGAASDYAAG
jgi:hypothetical protein